MPVTSEGVGLSPSFTVPKGGNEIISFSTLMLQKFPAKVQLRAAG